MSLSSTNLNMSLYFPSILIIYVVKLSGINSGFLSLERTCMFTDKRIHCSFRMKHNLLKMISLPNTAQVRMISWIQMIQQITHLLDLLRCIISILLISSQWWARLYELKESWIQDLFQMGGTMRRYIFIPPCLSQWFFFGYRFW